MHVPTPAPKPPSRSVVVALAPERGLALGAVLGLIVAAVGARGLGIGVAVAVVVADTAAGLAVAELRAMGLTAEEPDAAGIAVAVADTVVELAVAEPDVVASLGRDLALLAVAAVGDCGLVLRWRLLILRRGWLLRNALWAPGADCCCCWGTAGWHCGDGCCCCCCCCCC